MQSEYDHPIANFRSALSVTQIDCHPSADITQKSSMVVRVARLVVLTILKTCGDHINRSTDKQNDPG
jgi:hypothetical protein